MICIGIDPGKSGAMVIRLSDGRMGGFVFDTDLYALKLKQVNALCSSYGETAMCCLERVGAMPKQGLSSTFNFGENFGFIQGLLTANKIPYELVRPQKWKKEFGITSDKNTSIMVCQRLFPNLNLLRTEKCRKPHDGIAEAALMCEYARRNWGDKEAVNAE